MPNVVNTAITEEYEQLLGNGLDVLFVQPVGLDVESNNSLRSKLAESQLRMQLLKGSLARRVLAGASLEGGELRVEFSGAEEGA